MKRAILAVLMMSGFILDGFQARGADMRDRIPRATTLAIMKARFQERLHVSVQVERDAREFLVPSLLLQPLVENFVKHCMDDFTKPGKICISACRYGEFLKLEVRDNGPGMAADADAVLNGGVGLSNTRRRLHQLYGKDHRFEMANVPDGGLGITIEIPARKPAREAAVGI